jgi:hypothetical protein
VKRYSKLVTFAGATIVFLTFVVKEGWREHIKTLVESLDNAQGLYTLRADSIATSIQLTGMTSEIEAIRAKVTGTELGMTLVGLNRTMLVYSYQLRYLETSAADISRLIDELTSAGRYPSRWRSLRRGHRTYV